MDEDYSKKKITFFFSNTLVGGAETNIIKISRELKNYGFEIHYLVLEDNGPLLKGYEHIYSTLTIVGRYEKNIFTAAWKFYAFLKQVKPDYISCFGLRVDLFVRLLTIAKYRNTKIIGNIRASENWRTLRHSLIDKLTDFRVYKWVSNSRAGKEAFIKREGISAAKIEVIYNFIDIEKQQLNAQVDKIALLRVGILANYKKSKGHFNLMKISELLTEKGVEHIFICGGHEYTDGSLEWKIKEHNLQHRFHLTGYVSDKQEFFRGIDVLLLPSYMEGLPTSIIEAMAFGIPVIASNVDGIPEAIKNGYNGYLNAPDDLTGFAENLCLICDATIRRQFVSNGYIVLEDLFDKKTNVKKWISVFTS